eukprot:5067680-Ditylum_brightwellii.AAC.1
MPNSPNITGEQNVDLPASDGSQQAHKLDKIPVIPSKDTPMKKNETITVINEYKLRILFIVGENHNVKPRKKFAALLSIIISRFPTITLEEWDCPEDERAKSITAGSDLPHEKNRLEKFCPHDHHKTRLTTQWKIRSPDATFYMIKNDTSVISHLENFQIY